MDAEYGRVSYTQFEFLYARSRGKKTWLLFAGEACARDTPLERLDLPNDPPAHPDPAGYQAERRALQRAYCAQRQWGAQSAELLAQAVAAYRGALEVYVPEAFTADHQRVQHNLTEVEELLKRTYRGANLHLH